MAGTQKIISNRTQTTISLHMRYLKRISFFEPHFYPSFWLWVISVVVGSMVYGIWGNITMDLAYIIGCHLDQQKKNVQVINVAMKTFSSDIEKCAVTFFLFLWPSRACFFYFLAGGLVWFRFIFRAHNFCYSPFGPTSQTKLFLLRSALAKNVYLFIYLPFILFFSAADAAAAGAAAASSSTADGIAIVGARDLFLYFCSFLPFSPVSGH